MFSRLSLAVIALATVARATVDPAMECAFCHVALGMTEEIEVQVKFMDKMKADKCGKMSSLEKKACEFALDKAVGVILGKAAPEATCNKIGMCKDPYSQCKLFDEWPIKKLPDQPKEWPVERRELGSLPDYEAELKKFLDKVMAVVTAHEKSAAPLPTGGSETKFYDFMARLMSMRFSLQALLGGASEADLAVKDSNGCSMFDIKCKGEAVAKHLPFSDADGDFYSSKKEMRGSDWRGEDCDDKNADIHPGRAVAPDGVDSSSDWNCNKISGKNATGNYEDLFCSGANAPRPLLALGDSATAHFHLPPQWFTAKGWNLDGLKRVLEDEMDAPACSWSTGHVDGQSCPFQETVPGVAEGEVVSLYTRLRDRNRCNHNAYTNIGVNGARMTSSSGLVDAVKIDKAKDHPVTLWLSLIGNDVCKSDTNYTPLDEFYNDAVKTLQRLDGMLPPGSTVISLALFNGELLYDTMRNQQHPIGTTYKTLYDWLNCLQVSPCFGWLNSDGAIRRQTTEYANKLNDQYRKIQAQSKTLFKNIDYFFYDADYNVLFGSYLKAGYPGTNLIEKVDGFHPSQAGNAAFAITFFKYLEDNHPSAIGGVNPHNAEIDAMFFAPAK